MSVSTLTELWQYAALVMGETPATAVLDATTPTTPLEKTFNVMYDNVRRAMYRKAKPGFAVRSRVLREPPQWDYSNKTMNWDRRGWSYIYAPPIGSLSFLGFEQDTPQLSIKHPYVRHSLPVRYGRMGYTGTADGNDLVTSDAQFPDKLYRHWFYGVFHDDSTNPYYVYDVHYPTGYGGIFVVSNSAGPDYTNDVSDALHAMGDPFSPELNYQSPDASMGMDWTAVIASGTINVSAEKPVYVDYAYGDPYDPTPYSGDTADADSTDTRHIFTNLAGAIGVHVMDVEDVSTWADSFVNLVAAEMARRAAVVHAKSTKLLQAIAQERSLALNDAVADSWNDDAGGNRSISTTEQARQ